jgi:hypothetical protein
MSMFEDALAMHTAGLKAGFGKAATYQRGAWTPINVSVTVIVQGGGTNRQYVSKLGDTPEDTVYTLYPPEAGYCGFLVLVTDLARLSPPQPERGDKIIIGSDIYNLEAPAGTLPWKYGDLPYKTWFWCHTKLS